MRLSRLPRRVSRIPTERVRDVRFPAGKCFLCGATLAPGVKVLARGMDVRESCATCPWPQDAINEQQR